jgi:hypothetical protein
MASKKERIAKANTEISKQIFLEKEHWGLSPNFHIHASVSDLYIPRSVCLFCWRKYVIGAEAALFPEKEYKSGIFVAMRADKQKRNQ